MTTLRKTFLLLILDGFGLREDKTYNAIAAAKMPNWLQLWDTYPHASLDASGLSVGLPAGQIGNSEVGHMTISAGRTIFQDLTRIDQTIANDELSRNPVIQETIDLSKQHPVHLIGLLSPGGVHSHEEHFFEVIRLFAKANCPNIYLHLFLDGRDVAPQSAKASCEKLLSICEVYPQVKVASIMGRYYAMDRDQRWERTQLAYDALTTGQAEFQADDLLQALGMAYGRNETDEFVKPTWINHVPPIQDGDVVFFINFRSDRARQLSRAFLSESFSGFQRNEHPKLSAFISMTEYAKDIPSRIVFPPQDLHNSLGEYLAHLNKAQLRIAETEKYAHVTFFFNGGKELVFEGEERILIPSPKIATYDLQPEMSAPALTEKLVEAILSTKFDLIVCNFANPDMVGHTGNFDATVKALETIDTCLAQIKDALDQVKGEMLITADHGNADCMYDETVHQPHTAHTTSWVPLLYVGEPATVQHTTGTLADIAPSLLSLMQLPIPPEMTGKVIFNKQD
jgi:2,3-bisphosphoglycerate-independent phosphoglycerate mutase